jgi:type II secretory pathway component PulF
MNNTLESMKKWLGDQLSFFGMSTKEQVLFAKRFSFLMAGNISILESFQILRDQAHSRRYRQVLDKMIYDISNGQALSKSMAKFPRVFGSFATHIVQVGETGGMLSQNLNYLAEELSKKQALRRKLVGSFIYPAVITVSTLGIVMFLTIYLFPKLMPIFLSLRIKLPITTRILIFLSGFIRNYGLVTFLSVIAAIIIGMVIFKKNKAARLLVTRIILKIPFLGKLITCYNLANFCRTSGLLLKGGITLKSALMLNAQSTTNIVYQMSFQDAVDVVDRGESISSYFQKKPALFPAIFSSMIVVGERSGNVPDSFLYLAEYY